MAIRVAAGTADLICDYADGFVVEITGASDVDAATRALARARPDIEALSPIPAGDPEGPVVSQPVLGPGGPLIRVARLEVSDDLLSSIPDLVANRLEEAGVADAVVRAPEPGGSLDRLDSCPNAVVLRLFPPPIGEGGSLPASWIDIAGEWVLGDLSPHDVVPLRLLAVEFDVKVADAPAVLHQASTAQAWCDVVNGRIDERVRTASITFGRRPHVALAAGGPACDSQALLARFDLLCEVAREYAGDAAYACLDIETTFDGIGLGLPNTGWRDQGGASPNLVAGRLCDVLVPDAYPYQILGRGHLAGLGHETYDEDDPPIGETVAPGKVELFIGEPVDWLPIYDARGTGARAGLGAARAPARRRPAGRRAPRRPARAAPGAGATGARRRRRGPPAGRRDARPRRHHPGDAPPRPPRPAPHPPRAGRVARPRTPQRRPRERVAGARHLRPVVRVRARRPPAPDAQGPRPPPHRHRPARPRPGSARARRRSRPTTPPAAWLATDWLIRIQAAVVAPAGRPHRGGRPPRDDRPDQQPPRPGALGRRAGLRDHDRRPPDRPHLVDRRRRARRRQRPRRAGGVGRVGAGVRVGRLGRRVGGGVGRRARRARLRHRPAGDRVRARRAPCATSWRRPPLDRRHRVGHRAPLGGRRGLDRRLGRRPPRGRRPGRCSRCGPPPTAPSAPP